MNAIALLFLCAFNSAATADVIWTGAGTVQSNRAASFDVSVGSPVEWRIEYQEGAPESNPQGADLPLSIQFTFPRTGVFVRIDSERAGISGFGLGLVNWSTGGLGEPASYVAHPVESAAPLVLTMRARGTDIVDEFTYAGLREPSFEQITDYFGYIRFGSGELFFDVDTSSIEIYESTGVSPLRIRLSASSTVALSWDAPMESLFMLSRSSDLQAYFELGRVVQGPGEVTIELPVTDDREFYLVTQLARIFPLP